MFFRSSAGECTAMRAPEKSLRLRVTMQSILLRMADSVRTASSKSGRGERRPRLISSFVVSIMSMTESNVCNDPFVAVLL